MTFECDIENADDGDQAWRAYQKNKPTLILTDWNMHIITGYELITKIREGGKNDPNVLIATGAEKAEVIKALKACVNQYICKPFTPNVLQEKLVGVLSQYGIEIG